MSQLEVGNAAPQKLNSYFKLNVDARAKIRRRTVLSRSQDGSWLLVYCLVEAFPNPHRAPTAQPSRRYANVELHEDWLTPEACQTFVGEIQRGSISLGGKPFERKVAKQWFSQSLPPKNMFMPRPGLIARTRFEERPISFDQGLLLASDQPYYPDLAEAARDWLGLVQYHGESDGCNSEIVFLLPENRAYFENITSDSDATTFEIAGLSHARRKLTVKGAFWQGAKISQAEAKVRAGRAALAIPRHASRLDFVLIDANCEVYDRHYEGAGSHSGIIRKHASSDVDRLVELVRTACRTGENQTTEFKPFIYLDDKLGTPKDPTKYRELLKTIVAFANAEGGEIYLGVSDDCVLEGIEIQVQAWGKGKYSPTLGDRYCRALLNKVRGKILGEVRLEIGCVDVDSLPIAVVEVQPATTPLCIVGDNLLYRRIGASSMQIAPSQWGGSESPNRLHYPKPGWTPQTLRPRK